MYYYIYIIHYSYSYIYLFIILIYYSHLLHDEKQRIITTETKVEILYKRHGR